MKIIEKSLAYIKTNKPRKLNDIRNENLNFILNMYLN